MGNAYASIAPYDSYEASDGWFVIGCGNDKLYKIFCEKILHMPELVEDPRFDCNVNRVANNLELKAIIEENFAKQRTVKECVDMILGAGIPQARSTTSRTSWKTPTSGTTGRCLSTSTTRSWGTSS